jgi:hypothetical protein
MKMRNAAAVSVQKPALILSPARIKTLENLGDDDRCNALLQLGAAEINRAREEWRRVGSQAFDIRKQLQDGEDHFYATTESREERHSYEKRIDDAGLDIRQADSIVEILERYLSIIARNEIEGTLTARAAELRAASEKEHAAALQELRAAFAAAAKILSKIAQLNEEALAINRVLPNGCESIPILDVRLTGNPRFTSLIKWLTSLFPIDGLGDEIAVRWPGPGVYPEAVRTALAAKEEERRQAIAAARVRPTPGPSLQRTFVSAALPSAVPPETDFRGRDLARSEDEHREARKSSLVRDVHRVNLGPSD